MNRLTSSNLYGILTLTVVAASTCGQEKLRGYHAEVSVSAETRLDWVFALANQSPKGTPKGWLKDYESTNQKYELFAPKGHAGKASATVIFISPSDKPSGYRRWRDACRELGILFAGPYGAGNRCPMQRRVRIVLDVLDDLRRRFKIDPDRTYLAGFSGGGRAACGIAFALPEYFGGLIPICAGGDLRQETWLRHRVISRLSIAHLTGENDFNRGEVERMWHPQHAAVGVRSRVWVYPKLGHAVPDSKRFVEVFRWLEEGLKDRRALTKRFPASCLAEPLSRDQWAGQLFDEAKARLTKLETQYSGLMQLKGIHVRWNDLPQAKAAFKLLKEYEARKERPWEADDVAEQRRFLIARARAIDGYASGPLPKQYVGQRPQMAKAALKLWRLILRDGQDKRAVAEAKKRIPKLEGLLKERE